METIEQEKTKTIREQRDDLYRRLDEINEQLIDVETGYRDLKHKRDYQEGELAHCEEILAEAEKALESIESEWAELQSRDDELTIKKEEILDELALLKEVGN